MERLTRKTWIYMLLPLMAIMVACTTQVADGTPQVVETGDLKVYELTGREFRFFMDGVENPEIRVKLGDRVRIVFTGEDMLHDWKVDEFGAATNQVTPGQTSTIEFVADKAGTFEYYCSVGQHRANGMWGNLIVE